MTPYRFGTVQDRFEHRFGKIQNGPKRCQNGVQNENDLESLPMSYKQEDFKLLSWNVIMVIMEEVINLKYSKPSR